MKTFQACFSRPKTVIRYLPPSLERLLVELPCNVGVHQGRDVVDLLLSSFLEELAVTIGIFQCDSVAHREGHETFIKYEQAIFAQLLQFAQRNRLGSGTLNNFLDSVRAVFLFVPCYEFFSVIRIVAEGTNIVTTCFD